MSNKRSSPWLALGLTAMGSAAVTALARNFVSGERKIAHKIHKQYGVRDPQFERTMSQLLGPPILGGNRITPLRNGVEIFPAMLQAIHEAERTITLETYIYWSGRIADRFSHALAAKAREGVKVHVLLDGFGCNCRDGESLQRMRRAGVEVEIYHSANLIRANHRTHRKLMVVDGKTGFTGGVGIADQWDGNAESPDHWRDSHYKVEGPVVAQLQAAFLDNWMKTRARVLHGAGYFPKLEEAGTCSCQMFKSSPMEGSESARLMYLFSISAAEHSVKIANAYFLPDDLVTATLIDAVGRGVNVEVLLPMKHTDSISVRHASRHRWGWLLRNGVRIFTYQPTMYHCKLMIVDDLWTTVGSANFDNRSFRLNDEANLNVLDKGFAGGEAAVLADDKLRSKEFGYSDWRARSLMIKAADASAALLRSQL
jgi:cardiolipin synthase A/B